MFRVTAVFALLAAFAAAAAGAPVVLTDGTFASSVGDGNTWFVKFFAPWCGHCKRLAPTWEKLADEFADTANVNVATVDCTVERDACTQQDVRGYPTLKLFKGGSSDGTKYAGGRDLGSLADHVRSHAGTDEL